MHKEKIFGGLQKQVPEIRLSCADASLRDAHLPITPHGPWPKQMICIVGNYDDYDCDNGDDGISLRETPCVI